MSSQFIPWKEVIPYKGQRAHPLTHVQHMYVPQLATKVQILEERETM